MSEMERRLREMAMDIVKDPVFEDAMLLYEEAMRAEREEYRKKNPEDPSNGHYERKVKGWVSGANSSLRNRGVRKE